MASRITSRSVQPHGRHTCSSVSYCGRPFGSLLMRQPVPCRRLLAASCLHDGRQDAAGRAAGDDELPEALKDLQLTDDGILIDEKTGKQINEFGATRWDVAVRAMRGELDPPAWEDNTENNTGVILKSLIQFPADYMFQVVGQPSIQPGCTKEDFIQEMVDVVQSVCQESILDSNVEVVDRMRGKYVSLKVTCRVKTPELVAAVFSRLEGDQRVKMKF
uniref:DUF493 domain-containing protein n=1 Tax=Chlamydomonas euryale TaxID=1486919 RepID=A0A7R9V4J9_9CHLO|mmetsp:Transcript_19347/g.57383  ORF Transcript_19347/g.57383 Transcript_19347/m.57383 type:complete len:218 (+) Transcript_19347:237-890(+)